MRIRTGQYLIFETVVGKSLLSGWVPTGPVRIFQDVVKSNTYIIKKLKEKTCEQIITLLIN